MAAQPTGGAVVIEVPIAEFQAGYSSPAPILYTQGPAHDNREEMIRSVVDGLSKPQKTLPYIYFYDERGSALFEAITELPEYYVTRTELAILQDNARAIGDLASDTAEVVEFGSGSSKKTQVILDEALNRQTSPIYTPIDISGDALRQALAMLAARVPRLRLRAIEARYEEGVAILPTARETSRLYVFLGTSIGNMAQEEAVHFLLQLCQACRPGDLFLIGFDLVKDEDVLFAAYNDSASVTADFNLNLLAHLNAALGTDFDLTGFKHLAVWDAAHSRIEMRLISLRSQTVHLPAVGRSFSFEEGEYIVTEWSHKYTPESIRSLAASSGFMVKASWSDPQDSFALTMWEHR